jgi:DnaK suppressor protein
MREIAKVMKKADLGKYKELLEARQQELSKRLWTRDQIFLPKTPEPEEEAQMTAQQDLAVQDRNRAAALFRQVQAALDRIEDGSYGICLSCEDEIPPQRLEAVPWTSYCIQCQQTFDQQQAERTGRRHELVEEGPSLWRRAA